MNINEKYKSRAFWGFIAIMIFSCLMLGLKILTADVWVKVIIWSYGIMVTGHKVEQVINGKNHKKPGGKQDGTR